MLTKQKYTFQVRAYEIDPSGKLTMANLCNYLQEAAGQHAHALKVSSPQLMENGITWVLARLHVQMRKMPNWQENVTIETWPAQIDRLFAVRDFRIFVDNEEIGVATSAWVLMDLKSRRPLRRFPAEITDVHPEKPVRALNDSFKKLQPVETAENPTELPIRADDIDINSHVNNAVFIALLEDNLPESRRNKHQLIEIEIEFRGEAFQGDTLIGRRGVDGHQNEFYHSLTRRENNAEVIRARTVYSQ